MGSYSKGANGTFSGKVGSVVGTSWRSIDYLRSLPKKSKKDEVIKPLTDNDISEKLNVSSQLNLRIESNKFSGATPPSDRFGFFSQR